MYFKFKMTVLIIMKMNLQIEKPISGFLLHCCCTGGVCSIAKHHI